MACFTYCESIILYRSVAVKSAWAEQWTALHDYPCLTIQTIYKDVWFSSVQYLFVSCFMWYSLLGCAVCMDIFSPRGDMLVWSPCFVPFSLRGGGYLRLSIHIFNFGMYVVLSGQQNPVVSWIKWSCWRTSIWSAYAANGRSAVQCIVTRGEGGQNTIVQ